MNFLFLVPFFQVLKCFDKILNRLWRDNSSSLSTSFRMAALSVLEYITLSLTWVHRQTWSECTHSPPPEWRRHLYRVYQSSIWSAITCLRPLKEVKKNRIDIRDTLLVTNLHWPLPSEPLYLIIFLSFQLSTHPNCKSPLSLQEYCGRLCGRVGRAQFTLSN